MDRQTITLIGEPRGDLYRRILEAAAEEVKTVYVVLRSTVSLGSAATAALDRLKAHEIARREVTEWPGTKLMFGGTATLIEYRMSSNLVAILRSIADGLYEWGQPNLPEDLGFLRDDGSIWLASISHERDGYFEMSPAEKEVLLGRVPGLSSLITEEPSEAGP